MSIIDNAIKDNNNNKAELFNGWLEFSNLLKETKREGISELIEWLKTTDIQSAPASTRFHHSESGGLIKHSLEVYEEFVKLLTFYNIEMNKDEIIISALLHDLCKVNVYIPGTKNVKVGSNWIQEKCYHYEDTYPIGHGEKSIIMAQKFIKLTDKEIFCIRAHMNGFDETKMYSSSNVYNLCFESVLLHVADMMSSYKNSNEEENK